MPLDLLFPFTLPRLFRSPAISNFFSFPLGLRNSGVRLYLLEIRSPGRGYAGGTGDIKQRDFSGRRRRPEVKFYFRLRWYIWREVVQARRRPQKVCFHGVWKTLEDTSLLSAYTRFFLLAFQFSQLKRISSRNLLEYSFWHKTYFIHRILKGQLQTQTE